MLNVYTVCFFGHRYVDNYSELDCQVYKIICELIKTKEYVEFLIGRDGEFDQLVSSAIIRAKRNIFDANSSHTWVLPYQKAEYINNSKEFDEYYDSVEVCDCSASAHPKTAITLRNRNMVDRSELCIFYITNHNGGTWTTLKYAKSRRKKIILLQ
ncbi:MAG: hypothetical protein PHI87_06650 [Candidatus Methanomethylophilus sp.]|jgi:hypothetical protein|nr:hypothetical protein [Methanomethylophilus sp.]MDD4164615.1 hypothetical protein [Eubacteriales bacterium]